MDNQISSNGRVARNAVMLSVRMLLIMVVGLYTSRVVLSTLGVKDYGIYGLVGGIVAMVSFLNASCCLLPSRTLISVFSLSTLLLRAPRRCLYYRNILCERPAPKILWNICLAFFFHAGSGGSQLAMYQWMLLVLAVLHSLPVKESRGLK